MAGMLPGLFSPQTRDLRAEQQDEENRLARLAQNPFTADAYTAYSGAKLAGQGLARAAGGAMGLDTRSPTQKNVDAVKAQVAQMGFDPNDPKSLDQFYMNVVKILQGQGLVAEAADVAKEWRASRATEQNLDLKNRDLARKQKADDQKAAAAEDRNAIARERLGKSGPEALQLLDQLDNLDPLNPNDEYKRKAIMQRLDQIGGQNGVKFEQLGDRVIVTDMQGNPIRTDKTGAAPLNAAAQQKEADKNNGLQTKYNSAIQALQSAYNDAVELYNHPGLEGALGPVRSLNWNGKSDGIAGVLAAIPSAINYARLPAAAQDAGAKLQQVLAGSFISALQDLKAQSQTGASGLGQLTEVEGAKIQNAKAALDPRQPYPSFRAHLAQYVQQIANSVSLLNQNAQQYKLTPAPFSAKGMVASPGRYTAPQPSNQTIAPAAPPTAPAPSQPAPSAPTATPKTVSSEGWSIRKK